MASVGKILTILNEIGTFGGSFAQSGKLKSFLSDKQQEIEPKGLESFSVQCFCRYVLFTNDNWPIMVDHDDRRWPAVTCDDSKANDKEYFTKLLAVKTPEVAAKFMWYLQHRDISNWDWNKIPNTTARTEMKEMSLNPSVKFILDIANHKVREFMLGEKREAREY